MDLIGSTGGDDSTSDGDSGSTTGDGDTSDDDDTSGGDATSGDGDGDTTGGEGDEDTTGGDGDGDVQDCAALDALTLSDFAVETPPGWAPGGPVVLRGTMTNTSEQDINAYPGMLVAVDDPDVTPSAEGTWLFAIFAGMSSPIELALEVSEDFVSGTAVDVEITEDLLNQDCMNAEAQLLSLTIGE